jgi:hypothetical protein
MWAANTKRILFWTLAAGLLLGIAVEGLRRHPTEGGQCGPNHRWVLVSDTAGELTCEPDRP